MDRARVFYVIGTAYSDVNTINGEAVTGQKYSITYP